jgi:hypothetical protein
MTDFKYKLIVTRQSINLQIFPQPMGIVSWFWAADVDLLATNVVTANI